MDLEVVSPDVLSHCLSATEVSRTVPGSHWGVRVLWAALNRITVFVCEVEASSMDRYCIFCGFLRLFFLRQALECSSVVWELRG